MLPSARNTAVGCFEEAMTQVSYARNRTNVTVGFRQERTERHPSRIRTNARKGWNRRWGCDAPLLDRSRGTASQAGVRWLRKPRGGKSGDFGGLLQKLFLCEALEQGSACCWGASSSCDRDVPSASNRDGRVSYRQDPLERADVIIVLSGGRGDERVRQAADLYHRNVAPVVLLSGGEEMVGISIPELQRRQALGHGIPPSALRVEFGSTSTADQARFLRPILELEYINLALALLRYR